MKRTAAAMFAALLTCANVYAHNWHLPQVDEIAPGVASCRVYSEPMGSAITNYPTAWWHAPIVTRVIGQATNVFDEIDIDGQPVTVTNVSDIVERVQYPYTILDGSSLRAATQAERDAIDAAVAAAELARLGGLAQQYGARVGALQAALQAFGLSIGPGMNYETALAAIEAQIGAGTLTPEQMALIGSLDVIYKAARSAMSDDDIEAVFGLLNP